MQQGKVQLQTEIMFLQGDERIRSHREALKHRLQMAAGQMAGGLALEELELAVRVMLFSGRFHGTQGIPETCLLPYLPERFLASPSPFRTIAELSACMPWLLRVHQSMQWVSQMPNGLMTVQRLICPAASEMGGLAAENGVLAVDWRMVEEVMARRETTREEIYRPGMAGDPRFPRGAPPLHKEASAGPPASEAAEVDSTIRSRPPATAQQPIPSPTVPMGHPPQPPPPSAPPPFGAPPKAAAHPPTAAEKQPQSAAAPAPCGASA